MLLTPDGATLIQEGHPVAYASRALSAAEIEKELLTVVFGLEKFHRYTYGRQVKVQSDHKPLEIIGDKASPQNTKEAVENDCEDANIHC